MKHHYTIKTEIREYLQGGDKLDITESELIRSSSSQTYQNENKNTSKPTSSISEKAKAWPLPVLRNENKISKLQPLNKKSTNSDKKLKNSRKFVDPKQPTVKALIESYNKKTKEDEEESLKQEGRTNQLQLMGTKEDNNFKKATSRSVEGKTPTSENPPPLACEHKKHGFCRTLRTLSKQIEVTKSTWKDHGGGKGFGFVKSKVKKFICPDRNKSPVTPFNFPSLENQSTSHVSRHVGHGWEKQENIPFLECSVQG